MGGGVQYYMNPLNLSFPLPVLRIPQLKGHAAHMKYTQSRKLRQGVSFNKNTKYFSLLILKNLEYNY